MTSRHASPSSVATPIPFEKSKIARPLTFTLLRELSADHFTSGAALAEKHQVSRSAISDALKDASALGVSVFSLTRRSYRLATPLDFLDHDTVLSGLRAEVGRIQFNIVDTIDSTNSALLQQAALGAVSGTCLAAELQTAGRGRRGRVWHSAMGASLTFSLLWRFDRGVAALGGLSLVVGLAVANALRELGVEATLKWPNDILLHGQKLGGILIETQGDMLGPAAAVIGIGLNMHLPDDMKADIDQPATAIDDALPPATLQKFHITRSECLGAVLRHLVELLDVFAANGFAPLRDPWRALHAAHGQMVDVVSPTENFSAKVVDVAADGTLIVDRGSGKQPITAAEISIRMNSRAT